MRTTNTEFSLPSVENLQCGSEKIVVVSVIGKTSDLTGSGKGRVLGELLTRAAFGDRFSGNIVESLTQIDGFYCSADGVVYLHLRSPLDTSVLCRLCREMQDRIEETGFLTCWSELRYGVARALLLLFTVSHIVVVHQPNHVFDVTYIPIFHTIDACRVKLQRQVCDTLRSVSGVPPGWLTHGRLCPPRLLVYCASCPPAVTRGQVKSGRPPLEQLQHSLEDQIYRLLRKVRVITNASVQSLLALPGNQPFVYVEGGGGRPTDPLLAQVLLLQKLCNQTDERAPLEQLLGGDAGGQQQTGSFASLLSRHLHTARTRGFDDNLAKHLPPANFELPPANVWFAACQKLYTEIVDLSSSSAAFVKSLGAMQVALDPDSRFSEARCAKVLPIAVAAYQEGLPARYSLSYHSNKLLNAAAVFRAHARGPSCGQYLTQLETECEKVWKQGRQICEALSLTGNPCINPVHRLPDEPDPTAAPEEPQQGEPASRRQVMEHCSGVRYLATCNCGRKQGQRDDPFLVRRANYEYYVTLAENCCRGLVRHHFPVFSPGDKKPRAAAVRAAAKKGGPAVTEAPSQPAEEASLSPTFGLGLSQDEADDQDKMATETRSDNSTSPSDINVTVEKEEQRGPEVLPSTEEYLDGMVTTTTPPHLLPEYPSFSLVCVGQSSLYSHSAGLHGFLQGSNYLLPWELRMRTERGEAIGHKRYGKKKDLHDLYAKIFIGFEYECPRGHRFMLSAPDRVMKVQAAAQLKDTAARVANSDMPLYFNCPCSKKQKPFVGQLMRVHVVTPKSSVHVTLEARVQPRPEGPVYVPGGQSPVELTASAYWVLRLPYLYTDGTELTAPPSQEVPAATGAGRLLADTFGVIIRDEI